MKARLLILVVLAGGLAVWAATRPPTVIDGGDDGPTIMTSDGSTQKVASDDINEAQKMLWERELPGEEPAEEVNLSMDLEIETSNGKNRMVFYITEAHGFYVEDFDINFWYTGGDENMDPRDSPLSVKHRAANRYLEANGTLKECIELVPGELRHIDYDIGETEDWNAEIVKHGRARAKNPDPLPILSDVPRCN